MFKLDPPKHSFRAVLDACREGMTGNDTLEANVASVSENLLAFGEDYLARSKAGSLFEIEPAPETGDPTIVGNVRRSDLVKIYEQYFVAKRKPARKMYTDLMVAAKEQCPFCCGIGRPRNLDHFLPKARFPQFSVFPHNLVPSCRDCNMDGKAEKFATSGETQIVHPYVDRDCFARDQWIRASFSGPPDNPKSALRYFVDAPEKWDGQDKLRAQRHFEAFDIEVRYAIKAATLRGAVRRQVQTMQADGVSNEKIKKYILDPGVAASPHVNHWHTGLYQAYGDALA